VLRLIHMPEAMQNLIHTYQASTHVNVITMYYISNIALTDRSYVHMYKYCMNICTYIHTHIISYLANDINMLFALQLFVLKSLETYALLLLALIDISTAFFYVLAQNSFSILHKEYVNTYVCNSFI